MKKIAAKKGKKYITLIYSIIEDAHSVIFQKKVINF